MKIALAATVTTLVIFLALSVRADQVTLRAYALQQAANLTRPLALKPASTVSVASTAATSATSAQLTQDEVYLLKCTTAAYIDTSATSTCTASSADFPLPADTILPVLITADVRYVCARNVTADGTCYLVEGQ